MNLIEEIKTGLWKWYDFKPNSKIYFDDESEIEGKFDYIISVAKLEKELNPIDKLNEYKNHLNENGCILLGMNNRLGIKYFCGDRDSYTNRNFDSIENYNRAYANKSDKFIGRMYSKIELEKLLNCADLKYKFYSVLSDLNNASLIYAEEYEPNEDLANRLFPTYNSPQTIFLDEESLYQTLLENKLFHVMANAYLIECRLDDNFADVLHVTNSIERGKNDALFTIIHKNQTVEKKAVYIEGRERIKNLNENLNELKAQGLKVVDSEIINDSLIMPYIQSEVAQVYLKELLKVDKEKFLVEIDKFRDCILKSTETFIDNEEIILRRGYVDMMPLNSFYVEGEYVFFDQEFVIENCPLKMILSRVITTFYFNNSELEKYLSIEELYRHFGIEDKNKWQKLGRNFLKELRNEKELAIYHSHTRKNQLMVSANRQRINYSTEEYQKLFVDIFAEDKKIILFGSGRRTERFIQLYGMDYEISAIVDNNVERQGEMMYGIKIESPNILNELEDFKVIICVKSYLSIVNQLEEMNVKDFGIYDPNINYPRKRNPIKQSDSSNKKYKVGYIAGVFDLYHIGHLNMFKRAKEQCEYLIVGVVSDEGVRINKGVEPFVPFEERLEMVKSCRYVDEAVMIPPKFSTTKDAWKIHHFDVQFSGSDYVNDGEWLANKEFLNQHNSDLVFFSYTQSTSSTKLKKLIEKKLI